MKPSVDEAAERWLKDGATAELSNALFTQADIDQLFDEPPADAVRTGLLCLQKALQASRQSHPDLGGLLTIPLDASAALDLSVPKLSDLFARPWHYGPGHQVVGLYLTHTLLWATYEPVEEYRKDLSSEGLLPDGYSAYYRAWRPQIEGQPTWEEYDRTVYIRTTDS